MVVASKDKKLASAAQQLLASPHLRISTSRYMFFFFILFKTTFFPTNRMRVEVLYLIGCFWIRVTLKISFFSSHLMVEVHQISPR